MPQENSYESRLEELKARETEIRQRLSQIAEERTNEMNDVAQVYGVNATEVDLGIDSEREKLQEELAKIIKEQGEIFEARRQNKIEEDKQKREERQKETNRKGKLQQAYKFFTYLDTATTKGYDLTGLTEEDILNLYDDFMTKPEYEQTKRETLDRAMKNDREIIIPSANKTEKPIEEKNHEENKSDLKESMKNFVSQGTINPETDFARMTKKPEEQKEGTAIIKYEKPDGVEATPLEDIPNDAINTKIKEPAPNIISRAKEWISNNKKKVALIASAAALALGITMVTSVSASAEQNSSELGASAVSNQKRHGVEKFNEVSDIIYNINPTATDFSNQQFDPSILSGQDQAVSTTAADAMNNANTVVTNEWYDINGANLIGPDNTLIDTSNMTNEEVQELLNTGNYSVATTHDGVGMGFENAENVLDKIHEAQGGRSL